MGAPGLTADTEEEAVARRESPGHVPAPVKNAPPLDLQGGRRGRFCPVGPRGHAQTPVRHACSGYLSTGRPR